MSELCWLGAAEAAGLIRRRELSPVELTTALLERIGRHAARLNAFVTLDAEGALAAARRAEAEVMAGEALGPLHGVPYGLKDIIDAEGLPTTCHSAILRDNVARTDAELTRRLRAAGGILLGKLATHEFALGGPAFDLPWPPARNPWDPKLFPGGSSSGSGAAVAAGFMPAALGTDTGGSVRNPATMCGLVGMKASFGRVAMRGVFPLSVSLDYAGPLTRTVADSALLLTVLSGHDAADPASLAASVPDYAAGFGQGVKGLRIGVIRHFFEADMEASEEVRGGIEGALEVLRGLGASIVDITLPRLQDFAACTRIIQLTEACAVHERWLKERPADYGHLVRQRLLPGLFFSGVDYVQARQWQAKLRAEADRAINAVDVAVTVSAMERPFPIDDPQAVARFYPRHARTPFNLTDHPAMALPVGFTADGLPLGMQIIGRQQDEAMVYRVAHAYEDATKWHLRHPPLD